MHPTCSVQSVDGAANDDRVGGGRSHYAYVFPNLMLNRYGPWLDTNAVRPTGNNTCDVVYDYYLEAGKKQELEAAGELERFVSTSLVASEQV